MVVAAMITSAALLSDSIFDGRYSFNTQSACGWSEQAMNLALRTSTAAETSYGKNCSNKAGVRVCKGADDDWCYAAWCTAGCMTQTTRACLVLFEDVQYVIDTRWVVQYVILHFVSCYFFRVSQSHIDFNCLCC